MCFHLHHSKINNPFTQTLVEIEVDLSHRTPNTKPSIGIMPHSQEEHMILKLHWMQAKCFRQILPYQEIQMLSRFITV